MKSFLFRSMRLVVTLGITVVAIFFGWQLWIAYMETPWTRDGHVRANVVTITPDVTGLVSAVFVHDNQRVTKGQTLLKVDPSRFQIALDSAKASVTQATATLDNAKTEAERYRRLQEGSTVSQQSVDKAQLALEQAEAAYEQAQASYNLAQLNLVRTDVVSPADGIITNLALSPGDYVASGKGVMALVATSTIRVEGYFDESQLSHITVGDPVKITLMGTKDPLKGHVESIAAGIEDRERTAGSTLLANVTPNFTWVRLAQRVPVRVRLDKDTDASALIVGTSATVAVLPKANDREISLKTAIR
ncbi:efflux RND transporter periplasmic adaptor subunit [Agrobacterium larrymoorei]|uniref:RND family efflux transporter MFP subunit n=1 Tax=Agrobacterium larrymoorei TaxID=160699 RepID=A0ABU0UGL5_9HYPH|nr:HlyD family secretion protein [Agrobacterium larrymoorei]MDQ1184093.1 RND family efflux transporter MFP subunit [Agrobacterium larrymoorei]